MARRTSTETPRHARGLSAAEVNDRIRRGLVNDVPQGPTRSVSDIVRANVVTRFNILLSVLLVVILLVAPIQDALFGVVLVVNTAIGIIQELRAKQTLDRLALLSAPKARVVREGRVREVPISQVVMDDVLDFGPGDQVVVDGVVLDTSGLEVDESLLTGESDPVAKAPGDTVLSGSFVAAGRGRYQATKVGREAYAVQLAAEARRFTLVKSELRDAIDWILAAVSWAIVPTAVLLIISQFNATNSIREALRASVAGTVGMVPQGLVLLTSVAFAVGVVRLGRRQVLVQELPAVEGLARVDVVCFDKTGTLTQGTLTVTGLDVVEPDIDAAVVLGAVAAADPSPNATTTAVARAYPAPEGWHIEASVPFSSARKWSAVTFARRGTFILGAPEVVAPDRVPASAERAAARGERVLMLAASPHPILGDSLPSSREVLALVMLGDRIRPEAVEALEYFRSQGVAAKVISGDHPRTVAAIASAAGMDGAGRAVDARSLPEDPAALAAAMEGHNVFGRVTPRQKRAMVQALQRNGHVVAMTGDGVNDVLALKDADIGVAMGSGSSASRSVAQLVLLDGNFASLPPVVGEGRRVIANIERVANLFVTKTIYAMLLSIMVGVVGRPFPFLPRHLTLVGSLTIGIPAFVLALAPAAKRAEKGFIRRVLTFSIPVGTLAAAATFFAYELAIHEEASLVQARTTATVVLAAVGLFALVIVGRPLYPWRKALISSMAVILIVILLSSGWREFFELDLPRAVIVLAAIGIVGLTGAVMYTALQSIGWIKHVPEILRAPGPRRDPAATIRSFLRTQPATTQLESDEPDRLRRRPGAGARTPTSRPRIGRSGRRPSDGPADGKR